MAGTAEPCLCAVTGLFATGLFFSTNALGAGLLLRTGAGPPVFGVVELGPDGGVGAAELLIVIDRGDQSVVLH